MYSLEIASWMKASNAKCPKCKCTCNGVSFRNYKALTRISLWGSTFRLLSPFLTQKSALEHRKTHCRGAILFIPLLLNSGWFTVDIMLLPHSCCVPASLSHLTALCVYLDITRSVLYMFILSFFLSFFPYCTWWRKVILLGNIEK